MARRRGEGVEVAECDRVGPRRSYCGWLPRRVLVLRHDHSRSSLVRANAAEPQNPFVQDKHTPVRAVTKQSVKLLSPEDRNGKSYLTLLAEEYL